MIIIRGVPTQVLHGARSHVLQNILLTLSMVGGNQCEYAVLSIVGRSWSCEHRGLPRRSSLSGMKCTHASRLHPRTLWDLHRVVDFKHIGQGMQNSYAIVFIQWNLEHMSLRDCFMKSNMIWQCLRKESSLDLFILLYTQRDCCHVGRNGQVKVVIIFTKIAKSLDNNNIIISGSTALTLTICKDAIYNQ